MKLLAVAFALVVPACVVGDDASDSGTDDGGIDISADSVHSRVHHITTISYAPNSFVIGNAYGGWTDIVQGPAQFSRGPGNENGVSYRWGYLYGENFDHCAWVADSDVDATTSTHATNKCGNPQEIDTPYFVSTFTNGERNQLAGDGSVTHMQYDGSGCTDQRGFGNVAPWRVPATPANLVGTIPNGKELRWRYVTRDGKWVLVRDPAPTAGQPNWYFVHRGCVSVANVN